MRKPVARNDHNRAATHPDRSKRPQFTIDEGLLDYFAENAQDVAQRVYKASDVTITIMGHKVEGFDEGTVTITKK